MATHTHTHARPVAKVSMPKRRRSFGSNDKAGKETPDEATSRKEEQEDDAKPAATAKPESSTSSSLPLLDKNDISENTNNNDNDDNNRGVVVTPHMERLLRLMQQGTTESAQMAAGQLTLLTSQSSAAVLWEILGRLQAMMVSSSSSSMESSWKARQNAAVAMEGVAGNLPVLDQQAFFRTDRNYCHDQTNTSAEDNPSQRSTTTTSLRISDVSIQSVLQQGRELYVAAPSSIAEEWDQAGEAQLQRLDDQQEAAIAATTSKNNCDANDDFVQKRIQKQRRILAQRLGLAAIDDALKSHGATTNGGGNDNPLAGDIVSNADLNATYRSVAAAPKLAKRVRPNKQDKGTTGIQHILVREMNKVSVFRSSCRATIDQVRGMLNVSEYVENVLFISRRLGYLERLLIEIRNTCWRTSLSIECLTAFGSDDMVLCLAYWRF